jgi:hypothetical protein
MGAKQAVTFGLFGRGRARRSSTRSMAIPRDKADDYCIMVAFIH